MIGAKQMAKTTHHSKGIIFIKNPPLIWVPRVPGPLKHLLNSFECCIHAAYIYSVLSILVTLINNHKHIIYVFFSSFCEYYNQLSARIHCV